MKERAIFGIHAEPEIIYGSRIKFRLDQSSMQSENNNHHYPKIRNKIKILDFDQFFVAIFRFADL